VIGPRVHGRGRTRHGLLLGGEGRPGLFVHGDLSWRTVASLNGRITGPVPKRFGVTAQPCELSLRLFQLLRHREVLLQVRQRLSRPVLERCVVTGFGVPFE
jgi:hypothetical protein